MNNRLAVITGANGFVGSHLADYLAFKGYRVRCIVRCRSNVRWLEGKNYDIARTGLDTVSELQTAFHGASYIFHVAGVVKAKAKEDYYRGNVEATKNVLEAAKQAGPSLRRVVVVSSQAAVGPSKSEIFKIENDECYPITTYGDSKCEQERLAKQYLDVLPITICRPPAVFGERDTEILAFFQAFMKGVAPTIGWREKKISLIHVADLVRGIVEAAESEAAISGTYFITSPKGYTWEEIIDATKEATGKKALRIRIPHSVVYLLAACAQVFSIFRNNAATLNIEKAKDITQHYWLCSGEKATRDFSFTPSLDLREGIARTTRWYQKTGWLN